MDMFSKKIATYNKIKFPQQANSMVWVTRRNCAYDKLFWQIKPKIILILIQLRQKLQNLIFLQKWTYNKIELTSRIIEADQPLYTIAKKTQCKYPDSEIGEDSFFVMLSAMHTEKMLWSVSGDRLECSGWTTVVTNSGVATSGTADSFLSASHICKTMYMHTVSVAALPSGEKSIQTI